MTPSRVVRFLLERGNYKDKDDLRDITFNKVYHWADFWEREGESVANMTTAILVRKYEQEDSFPSRDYEKGYREGIRALQDVWRKCHSRAAAENSKRKAEKKFEEYKEKKKERLSKINKLV